MAATERRLNKQMEKEKTNIQTNKKEVAKDLFQEMLIANRDAWIQCLSGRHPNDEEPMTPDQLVHSQERGLFLVMNTQLLIVTFIRPIIKTNDMKTWKEKHKSDDEQKENPFNKEDNDYSELRAIEGLLNEARTNVSRSKRTNTRKDDYIWYQETATGQYAEGYWYTTPNFDDAVDLLRETYEEIFGLMIKHEIISTNSLQVSKNQLGSMF